MAPGALWFEHPSGGPGEVVCSVLSLEWASAVNMKPEKPGHLQASVLWWLLAMHSPLVFLSLKGAQHTWASANGGVRRAPWWASPWSHF